MPVLILSAVGDESQKVAALDAGADDYVTKPFGVAELLARLRASLRRVAPVAGADRERRRTRARSRSAVRLTVAGRAVQLTRTEFALLSLLARHAGKLFTHRAILREVWGPAYQSEVAVPSRARLAPARQDRARPDAARATS